MPVFVLERTYRRKIVLLRENQSNLNLSRRSRRTFIIFRTPNFESTNEDQVCADGVFFMNSTSTCTRTQLLPRRLNTQREALVHFSWVDSYVDFPPRFDSCKMSATYGTCGMRTPENRDVRNWIFLLKSNSGEKNHHDVLTTSY